MPEAALGRIVQYVLQHGRSKGQARPAQIVSIFDQASGPPLLNLVVTLDGSNDESPGVEHVPLSLHRWETSVAHADPFEDERITPNLVPGTWHWPKGVR